MESQRVEHNLATTYGVGNSTPLQYPFLENSMGREAWRAMVRGVTESGSAERLSAQYKCMHMCWLSLFSRVWLYATPWTIDHQAPLSIGFSRQECWSGVSFPPPQDLPNPGIKIHVSWVSCLAGRFFTSEPPGKPQYICILMCITLGGNFICKFYWID